MSGYTLKDLLQFLNKNKKEINECVSYDDDMKKNLVKVQEILIQLNEFQAKYKSYWIINKELKSTDKLTSAIIAEAIKKGFNCSACNSAEHFSMMKHLNDANCLQNFFDNYLPAIEGHLKYKPGKMGAKEAAEHFKNLQNNLLK